MTGKNGIRIVIALSVFALILYLALIAIDQQKVLVIQRDVENPHSISILWAKWAPADYLQKLTMEFTEQTGIEVRIVQESWSTWQNLFFSEMEKRKKTFDMVIGDSQWLGRGVKGGHYIELTSWIKENGVDQSMTEASITGYSEYPKGSNQYWAVPVEGDAMGFSYRKDLFENEKEKQVFEEKFGYPLDVPNTWEQLYDIASFFHRPEEDLYGLLSWVEPDYDGITMGVQSLIWAWGGYLGNQKNYKVKGILNTKENTEALLFYKRLNQFNNPQWEFHYLDKELNSNIPMMQGKVAMAMGYFAITTELLDKQKNPYADSIGFFANPKGPRTRVCSLGGQGVSIVSYSPKKAQCLQFLEWFVKESTQKRWAELGGLSCNKTVLSSKQFLQASPINMPFKESIEMARDFWAVPEYAELLQVSQKYWNEYVMNSGVDPRQTLDLIAEEWEGIFERYGYYKE